MHGLDGLGSAHAESLVHMTLASPWSLARRGLAGDPCSHLPWRYLLWSTVPGDPGKLPDPVYLCTSPRLHLVLRYPGEDQF